MVPYDGLRGPGDVLQLSDCDLTASGFDSLNRHVWCSRASAKACVMACLSWMQIRLNRFIT